MKKVLVIAVLIFSTLSIFAQPRHGKKEKPNFSPEQMAELQTKKMTLSLDLTEQQQAQIFEVKKQYLLERKEKMEARKAQKEAGKELSNDERFEMRTQQLDKAIARKKQMRAILSDEQFEKWEKMAKRSAHKMKRRVKKNRHAKKR